MNCIIVNVLVFASILYASNGAYDGLSERIIGGDSAYPGEFPHHAIVLLNDTYFCGGAIIAGRVIVTAGHCIFNRNLNEISVVVGTNKLDIDGDKYETYKLIVHPGYNAGNGQNDLGLILLIKDIVENDMIKPIPLSRVITGEDVTVQLSGFGYTSSPGQRPSNDLQKITLKTISDKSCSEKAKLNIRNQICTLTKVGEGVCLGDSGSPLVANNMLVGIVSRIIVCAEGYPDIYIRISSYVAWIAETIDNN